MGTISDKLYGMQYEVAELERLLFHYREYYLADKDIAAEYDRISPGLNTPLSPNRKRDHEEKLAAHIDRRGWAEHFIKQYETSLLQKPMK